MPYNPNPNVGQPNQVQQPQSLSSTVFGGLYEYNKFRMWHSALGGTSMRNLAAGRGMSSPGMIGLRGILSGTKGPGGSFYNPVRKVIEGGVRVFGGQTPAARFKDYGLFGKSTVNVSGTNISRGLLRPEKAGKMSNFMNILGGGDGIFKRQSIASIAKIEGLDRQQSAVLQRAMRTASTKGQVIKSIVGFGDQKNMLESMTKPKTINMGFVRSGATIYTDTNTKPAALMKYTRAAAARTALATAGRAVNIMGWASLAYGATKFITKGVVNLADTAANTMEEKLRQFSNNQMEFGGEFEQGFFSAQAATDRQRALKAISQTGLRARSLAGNEASMNHTASTW